MNKSASSNEPSMDCPRCGYDQSGVVASWQRECPMEGVCSECGLRFEWGDVLNRSRVLLPWLYEHRRGLWLYQAFGTMFRALIPWRFWREVELHHTLVVRRQVMYPIVLLIAVYLVTVGMSVFSLAREMLTWGPVSGDEWVEAISSIALFPIGLEGLVTNYPSEINTMPIRMIGMMFVFSCGMVLVLGIASSSRKISGIKTAHLGRAVSYGMTLAMWLFVVYMWIWAWDQIQEGHFYTSQYSYYELGYDPITSVIRGAIWGILLNEWVLFGGCACWMAVWWWFALRDGFQLASFRQVYIAGVCVGLLMAAFLLMDPSVLARFYY